MIDIKTKDDFERVTVGVLLDRMNENRNARVGYIAQAGFARGEVWTCLEIMRDSPPFVGRFARFIVWIHDDGGVKGRRYFAKLSDAVRFVADNSQDYWRVA